MSQEYEALIHFGVGAHEGLELLPEGAAIKYIGTDFTAWDDWTRPAEPREAVHWTWEVKLFSRDEKRVLARAYAQLRSGGLSLPNIRNSGTMLTLTTRENNLVVANMARVDGTVQDPYIWMPISEAVQYAATMKTDETF